MDEIVISNTALAYLGDEATVSDLSEGSTQSDLCAQFLPACRRSILEMHDWSFARRSAILTLQNETVRGWQYAYGSPKGLIKMRAVLPPDAGDDYSLAGATRAVMQSADGTIYSPIASGYNNYTPQPFTVERSYATGAKLILTNQEQAVGIYTFDEEDYSQYTPLACEGMAWMLAAKLAGPIYKGKSGIQIAQAMLQSFALWKAEATKSDANQSYEDVRVSTPWINGR